MKKFTFIIVAVLLASMTFAQKQANISPKPVDIKINKTEISPKDIQAGLNETFTVFPPASWSQDANEYWVGSADWSFAEYASYFGDGSFAVFEAFNIDSGEEGSLITPELSPTAGDNTITFDVIEMLLNEDYIGTGLTLYVEVSTDGGTSWTTSTTNVLESIANHNTATVSQDPTNLSVDLSAYNDQTIKVRFRSVSDYGGFDLFLDNVVGPEAAVVLGPTNLVVTAGFQNKMTPLTHATYSLFADISNTGEDLAAAATLTVSVTPGTFTEDITIETPFVYGAEETFACENFFTADATGTYTATFSAPLTGDPNTDDNTDDITFEVTETVFAADNGVIAGGGGSNSGPLTYGSLYILLSEDVVTSYTIGWPATIDADDEFTISIYSIDPTTGAATEVYTSGTMTKTVAMAGTFADFDIEDQTLAAGAYLFAVNQLDATNLAVGYDGVAGGMTYILNTTTMILGGTDQLGALAVRANILESSSVENTVAENISVYPNPANNVITVANAENSNIVVLNMVGEVVASIENASANQTIDISNLASGAYFVRVNSEVFKVNVVK